MPFPEFSTSSRVIRDVGGVGDLDRKGRCSSSSSTALVCLDNGCSSMSSELPASALSVAFTPLSKADASVDNLASVDVVSWFVAVVVLVLLLLGRIIFRSRSLSSCTDSMRH